MNLKKLFLPSSVRPNVLTSEPKAHRSPKSIDTSGAVRQADIASLYSRPSSFTDLLPWVEYLPESACFALEDGQSVGAVLELTPIGSEARESQFLESICDGIQIAISDTIPEDELDPWILQLYLQDQQDLQEQEKRIRIYGSKDAKSEPFSQHFDEVFSAHLRRITKTGGLFEDKAVTGSMWRGQLRRIRAVIYKRHRAVSPMDPERELNDVVTRFAASLAVAGVQSHRMNAMDFARWLFPWFNPKAASSARSLSDALGAFDSSRPEADELPYAYDFAEQLMLSMPVSNAVKGRWWFDGLPHEALSLQGLRKKPMVGLFTAEQQRGDSIFALFDRMPENSILAITVEIQAQQISINKVARIKRAAVGDSAESMLTREDATKVEREMARGNKLYPVSMCLFLRGNSERELEDHVNQASSLLLPNGLQPLIGEADPLKLDSYIRNLPMCYEPKLDRTSRRSKMMFAKHAASLLPLYGRARGTGHSGFVFFNRGAEPIDFDPLHPDDRKKNGHMLILGPTGAGKSALLVYLLQQMMARHRPRIFIIEAGGSFELLGKYFNAHGISVNQVSLNVNEDVSLPPFADALNLVTDVDNPNASDASESMMRDRLGEMEIVARIMITGGDRRENERMSRADRLLVRTSILQAAQTVGEAGRHTVRTDDVVTALRNIGAQPEIPDARRLRALEMADGMGLFCSGVAGHFFNREGNPWPDADVTILEMGLLAREGYEDQLTVAYLSMMSHINDLVERNQHSERQTLVVTDEGHIITTHPLLANYVVKITKMWRKYGAWFWIATQNLADFPDESRRMLNMIEWWMCLVMPKDEVEQVARFRELTDAQRRLLLSARKEPGKYTEGVVLSDKLEILFRNVPPVLSLALAMSEKHEKAERRRIMDEQNCNEYEAACEVARQIELL